MDLSNEKFFLFMLVALPGVIAISVHDLLSPPAQRDWKNALVDAIAFSAVHLALWYLAAGWIVRGFVTGLIANGPTGAAVNADVSKSFSTVFDYGTYLCLYSVVTPAVLSFVWHLARPKLHCWLGFDHPVRTAWNWAFFRKEPFYLIFHLKDRDENNRKEIVAGYFNGNSYVTTFPNEPEIFVERAHTFDREKHMIGDAVPDSKGMLIKYEDCEIIEFKTDNGYVPSQIYATRLLVWLKGETSRFKGEWGWQLNRIRAEGNLEERQSTSASKDRARSE